MVLGDLEAKARDPEAWAILLDVNGNLAEGIGSNVFLVRDGAIYTPREQFVLPGISRETAIELARELGYTVHERDIDLFDAYNADEAFLTSTSLCVCAVRSFNGVEIGGGRVPGPVTQPRHRGVLPHGRLRLRRPVPEAPRAIAHAVRERQAPDGPAAASSPTVLAPTSCAVARHLGGGRGAAGLARRLRRPALRAAGRPARGVTRPAAAGPIPHTGFTDTRG